MNSEHLEANVIGAMLRSSDVVEFLEDRLIPEDFSIPLYSKAYEEILSLKKEGLVGDLVVVSDKLSTVFEGASEKLRDAANNPSTSNLESHSALIKENSIRRQLIDLGSRIVESATNRGNDINNILNDIGADITRLQDTGHTNSIVVAKDVLPSVIDNIKKRESGATFGIKTPFPSLNRLADGFGPGDLVIIAARPSMGKTALALNIATEAAKKDSILFFSLEMSKEQLSHRIICSEGSINAVMLRQGETTKEIWEKIDEIKNKKFWENFSIDDTGLLSANMLRARARRYSRAHNIGLIVVDYIQLMRSFSPQNNSREREVAEISGGLKALAKELNVPIVALSQLNRQLEGRSDKRPQMSDLRESGALEQDADLILFLYREDYYFEEAAPGKTELIIAKQRNGPTGIVKLFFDKEITKFIEQDL